MENARTPANSTKEANTTMTERRCTPDKASLAFKPVVAWLLARTPSEKLAAVALANLLLADVQNNLKDTAHYAGNIGEDLLRDWREDVLATAADTKPTHGPDAMVARFVMDCEAVYDD